MKKSLPRGFTLIELLVVIAILAILAVTVYLAINPIEILRRGRDTTRLTDLQNLKQAITVALAEGTGDKLLCNGSDLPCSEKSNPASALKKASDGTGWVKVNVKNQQSVSMATLPLDSTNDNTYHYTYCADTKSNTDVWEISTVLESDQQKGKMLNSSDGGNEDDKYEIGSDLTLIAPEGQGSCTY